MILLISFCIKSSKECHFFHFKGCYMGQKISMVEVHTTDFKCEPCDEYLLKLKVVNVQNSILICDLIQSKKLSGLSLI
jgi:hypothetical protein